jgi:CRISPR-associated protein Csm2
MAYSNNSYGNNFGRQQAPARQVNITEKKKIDKKTYVDLAEKVIAELPRDNRDANKIQLSTNQIRNVLSLINELYDMVRTDTEKVLSGDVQSHIQYVKMKIIYAAGKDNAVKTFLEKSLLISYLNGIGDSRNDLILVCHYMEALVAYHRFNTNEK